MVRNFISFLFLLQLIFPFYFFNGVLSQCYIFYAWKSFLDHPIIFTKTKILYKLECINICRVYCDHKRPNVRKFLIGWLITIFNSIQLIKATTTYYTFQKTVKTLLKTNLLMRWLGSPPLIPILMSNCHLWPAELVLSPGSLLQSLIWVNKELGMKGCWLTRCPLNLFLRHRDLTLRWL